MAKGIFVDRVGEEYKGFKIVEELGRDYVGVRCVLCGYESVRRKSFVIEGRTICKNCKGTGEGLIGQTFRGLEIVGIESDRGFVECRCQKCKIIDKYRIVTLRREETLCKHCGVNRNLINTVGNVYGNFEVVQELGVRNKTSFVAAKCRLCGSIGEYRKQQLQNKQTICKKCRKK